MKIAFVCKHGFTSKEVAKYAKKLEKEMPGIEVIPSGFGHKEPHDTRDKLAEHKPDLIFYIPKLQNDILPEVKSIGGNDWAFTQKTVYGHIVPDKTKAQAARKFPELKEPQTVTDEEENWAKFHLSLALQAKNWLEKNNYITKPKKSK